MQREQADQITAVAVAVQILGRCVSGCSIGFHFHGQWQCGSCAVGDTKYKLASKGAGHIFKYRGMIHQLDFGSICSQNYTIQTSCSLALILLCASGKAGVKCFNNSHCVSHQFSRSLIFEPGLISSCYHQFYLLIDSVLLLLFSVLLFLNFITHWESSFFCEFNHFDTAHV